MSAGPWSFENRVGYLTDSGAFIYRHAPLDRSFVLFGMLASDWARGVEPFGFGENITELCGTMNSSEGPVSLLQFRLGGVWRMPQVGRFINTFYNPTPWAITLSEMLPSPPSEKQLTWLRKNEPSYAGARWAGPSRRAPVVWLTPEASKVAK